MKQQFLRRALGGALSIGLLMQPALAAVTPDIPQGWTTPFSDVAEGDWYTPFVSTLNSQGVINGYDDGRFGPNDAVRAGDAILMVVKAAGSGNQPALEGAHYAAGYVQYALDRGWLTQAQAAVDLNAPASRLYIAALAAKALGLSASTKRSPFADVSDGYVTALYQNGVVVGEKSGGKRYFKPDNSITRAELSVIVWQVMAFDNYIHFSSHVLEKLDGVPVNRYDNAAFVKTDGRMEYVGGDRASLAGVDVSSHQGTVDWAKVAADGIDFVIIRCGGRYYGSGKVFEDKQFKSNIRGALDAGLQVGVYFFSQATNQTEALEEAQFVLDTIADYPVDGPVVFDWENIGTDSARTDGMTSAQVTAAANAFCGRIKAAGYQPMIYFNQYIGYLLYDLDQVTQYPFWLAEYTDKPTFYYHFEMWQHTSSGSVDGITGKVDRNLWMPKEAPVRPDRPSQETEPGEDEEAMPPSQDISREQS